MMRPGMSLSEDFAAMDDLHPIDIVETLAEHHAWEFDRVTDDQIAMAVEGQWRTYSLTLAWSGAGRNAAADLHLRDGAARPQGWPRSMIC
jgi:hypothetical protein